MSEVNFVSPVMNGDIIEFGCDLLGIGNTSISVKLEVRNKTTKKKVVEVDKITFVNLDKFGIFKKDWNMNVAVLVDIIKETKTNWRFIFESPLYDNINFIPGQLIQLGFIEEDESMGVPPHPIVRNYSVASWYT